MDEQSPTPGWYDNPEGEGQRFWDGIQWTDQYREGPLPSSAPRKDEGGDPTWLKVAGWVLAAVVVLTIILMADDDNGGGGDDDGDQDRIAVQVVCEDFVEDRLKAPATAGFPVNSDWTITRTGDTWTARSHVDAENSFGANIRNNFVCEVRHVSGDRWRLVDLQME